VSFRLKFQGWILAFLLGGWKGFYSLSVFFLFMDLFLLSLWLLIFMIVGFFLAILNRLITYELKKKDRLIELLEDYNFELRQIKDLIIAQKVRYKR
jgi:hypothetical protein